MSFQNLAPCLSQVEVALKQCLAALNAEHPVSVSALSETIGHCANALNQLQPIISQLVKQEDSLLSVTMPLSFCSHWMKHRPRTSPVLMPTMSNWFKTC